MLRHYKLRIKVVAIVVIKYQVLLLLSVKSVGGLSLSPGLDPVFSTSASVIACYIKTPQVKWAKNRRAQLMKQIYPMVIGPQMFNTLCIIFPLDPTDESPFDLNEGRNMTSVCIRS